MAEKKEEKKSTVVVDKVVTTYTKTVDTTPKVFQEGNIQINGKMTREQFDKAFKGKISVDINQLWNRYQLFLGKNK
jgi:predicted thioredoxin/glutaredoxin